MPHPESNSITEPPDRFLCPISLCIMREPVVVGAHYYDKASIESVIAEARANNRVPLCPMTREKITHQPVPVAPLRREILSWIQEHPQGDRGSFFLAAQHDVVAAVDEQLFFGISPTCQDEHGRNILHFIAQCNSTRVFRFLVQRCSRDQILQLLNAVDCEDRTPLHFAAMSFNATMYNSLKDMDRKTELRVDKYGNSPVMLSINTDPEKATVFVKEIFCLDSKDAQRWINHCSTLQQLGLRVNLLPEASNPSAHRNEDFSIEAFLTGLGHSDLLSTFQKEEVTSVDVLQELTKDDLNDLGINTLGGKKKFLAAVSSLQQEAGPSVSDRLADMRELSDLLFKGDLSKWQVPWSTEMKSTLDLSSLRDSSFKSGYLRPLLLPILDAINRSLPLRDILTELQQHVPNTQRINAKNLLCALFYILPHEKLFGVAQRLAQSETPIPLISASFDCLPLHSSEADSQPVIQWDCFLKDHILNLLHGNKMVASVRSEMVRGNSSFLNAIYSTQFDTNCVNPFHDGSVDVVYDATGQRGAHIIDLHGSFSNNMIQAQFLSHVSSLLLVHITEEELPLLDDPDSRLYKLLNQSSARVLIIVRDASQNDMLRTKWKNTEMVQITQLSENRDILQSQLLQISKLLHPFLRPRRGLTERHFDELETVSKRCSPLLHTEFHSEGIHQVTYTLSQMLTNHFSRRTRSVMFPFTAQTSAISKLEESQQDTVGAIQELKSLGEKDVHPLLRTYFDAMLLVESEDVMLLTFVVSSLISFHKKTVVDPLLKERSERLKELNQKKIRNADQDSTLSRITHDLHRFDFGTEHLWRELISLYAARELHHHDVLSATNSKKLEDLCVDLMKKGIPMEIINGDSKTLHVCFLKRVFEKLHSMTEKPVFVLSIAGPQSTGKSTLLNFLFGTIFPVRAGRCSRGLFATYIETYGRSEPNLLVLDSEGLFSIERGGDSTFDKQMMLICLVASNLMLLNVQGNFNESQKGVFTIAVSSIKLLGLNHRFPLYRIVLRDIGDRSFDPVEVKQKIMQDFSEISATMGSRMETIVRTDDDSQFITMSPAFNSVDIFVNGTTIATSQASSAFSRDCAKVKQIIANDIDLSTRTDNESGVPVSLNTWFSNTEANWILLNKYGSLINYDNFRQYITQKELDSLFHEVYSVLSREFSLRGDELITNTSKRFDASVDISVLDSEVIRALNELLQSFSTKAVEAVNRWKKMNRFSVDSLQQKQKDLKNILQKDHTRLMQQWNKRRTHQEKRTVLDQFKQELKAWVEDHTSMRSTSTDQLLYLFDKKLLAVRQRCTQSLKSDQSISKERVGMLINEYFEKYLHSPAGKRITESVLSERSSHSWSQMKKVSSKVYHYFFGKQRKPSQQAIHQAQSLMKTVDVLAEECVVQYPVIEFSAIQYVMDSLHKDLSIVVRNHEISPNFDEALVQRLRKQLIHHYWKREQREVQKDLQDFDQTAMIYREWFENHAQRVHEIPQKVSQVQSLFLQFICSQVEKELTDSLKSDLKKRLVIDTDIDTPEKFDDKCFHHMNDAGETNESRLSYYTDLLIYQSHFFQHHRVKVLPNLIREFESKWSVLMSERHEEIQERIAALKRLFQNISFDSSPEHRVRSDAIRQSQGELFTFVTTGLAGILSSRTINMNNGQYLINEEECLWNGSNYESVLTTLIQDQIPNFHAFMDCLSEQFRIAFENAMAEPPQFHLKAEEQADDLFSSCRGCLATCPYCGAKCTYHEGHEGTHHTEFHKFMAYGGVHVRSTNKASLELCNTGESKHMYGYGSERDTVFTFEEHHKKYHSDWRFVNSEERRYESIMRGHWLRIGRSVCEKYGVIYHEDFGNDSQ